jgi:hypothetical protein
MSESSSNNNLSRRDFMKVGAVAVLSAFLTSCGVSPEEAVQIQAEQLKYKPMDIVKSSDNIKFSNELINDNRIGSGKVVFAQEGGGMYFKKNGQYKELSKFGTYVPKGDPNIQESWDKLKQKDYNGTELFWIWQTSGGIESESYDFYPALDCAIKADVQVMPMVNFSICDIEINGDGKQEYVFSQKRLEELMKKAGDNIIGFQFDEPMEGGIMGGTQKAKFDYVKFIEDYSKVCALPLRIINSGRNYLANRDQKLSNEAEYTYGEYHQKMINTCVQNNVNVITGSDHYPYLWTTPEDFPSNIELQIELWKTEVENEKNGVTSWCTFAGHDGFPKEPDGDNVFPNMQNAGNTLPFLIGRDGFAKLQIFQIVSALAVNPKYSRFDWWTWPKGDIPNIDPYDKTGAGIEEAIELLGSAIPFINGKVVDTNKKSAESDGCECSIKQIIADDGKKYEAMFVRINSDGGFPRISINPGTYKDLITGVVFKTGGIFNQIEQPKGLGWKKNMVMCLVPAEEDISN